MKNTAKWIKGSLAICACLALLAGSGGVLATEAPAAAPPPENMQSIGNNGTLKLYADKKSGEFCVQDTATGAAWYSNPVNRAEDEFAKSDKTSVSSQILLKIVDMGTNQEEQVNNYISSVKEEAVAFEELPDGFRVIYTFKEEQISVPLEVTLQNGRLETSVAVGDIVEAGSKRILQLTLLPYFGAGYVTDEGYMVVPDGSGALINFNNHKQSYVPYIEPLYGSDAVLTGNTAGRKKNNSCLPLFGIKKGETAIASIITAGDGAASVSAKVSKKGSGFNNVCAVFTLRSTGTHTIGDYYSREITTYEKGDSKVERCTVRSYFLQGEAADYTGMAKTYAQYLQADCGVTPVKGTSPFSIFVELYGGVMKTKTVLGFPSKVVEPLTTFDQAVAIMEELKAIGAENVLLSYQNWSHDGILGKIAVSPDAESKLGGGKGLKRLQDYAGEKGIPLAMNVNFSTFQKSGNGFSTQRDVAKLFTGIPGVAYGFKLNTQQMDSALPRTFYLAPRRLSDLIQKYRDKSRSSGVEIIGLDTLGSLLYSDFAKNGMNRDDAKTLFAEQLRALTEDGKQLFVRTGNAYTLPFTSYVFDMPEDDSYNDMVDESIPLFQIALSGLIPYAVTDINHNPDPIRQFLTCIEYGSDLKFTWTYESADRLVGTELDTLCAANYKPWLDFLEERYPKAERAAEELTGAAICGHMALGGDVYQTVYDNGKSVVVNYGAEAVSIGGLRVEAQDFEIIDRGDFLA